MAVITVPDLGAEVGLQFPSLYSGRRVFAPEEVSQIAVEDIPARVHAALQPLVERIQPDERVAITAGSRGIANMPLIVRACGEALREFGADPFVMPAMGSHGGATAEGQRDLLAGYGITRETVGMPVISSMDVEHVGNLADADGTEIPVYMCVTALEADHVLLLNRVKPHTDFRGRIESGLAKICAIGLGKQRGAQIIHSFGTRGLAELMPRAARCIIDRTGKILGGLAIVENPRDETSDFVFLEPDAIGTAQEEALQARAKGMIGALPFNELDVLIVDEMGKNVSGTGMDTNVIGRMFVPGVAETPQPNITAVVVLDLTEESHGNAVGLGLADFTTEQFIAKIDWQATYTNSYTSGTGGLLRGRIPTILANDRAAIATAMRMCGQPDTSRLRVARIKNTLRVAEVQFSPSLLDDADRGHVEVTGSPRPMHFDTAGRLQ